MGSLTLHPVHSEDSKSLLHPQVANQAENNDQACQVNQQSKRIEP